MNGGYIEQKVKGLSVARALEVLQTKSRGAEEVLHMREWMVGRTIDEAMDGCIERREPWAAAFLFHEKWGKKLNGFDDALCCPIHSAQGAIKVWMNSSDATGTVLSTIAVELLHEFVKLDFRWAYFVSMERTPEPTQPLLAALTPEQTFLSYYLHGAQFRPVFQERTRKRFTEFFGLAGLSDPQAGAEVVVGSGEAWLDGCDRPDGNDGFLVKRDRFTFWAYEKVCHQLKGLWILENESAAPRETTVSRLQELAEGNTEAWQQFEREAFQFLSKEWDRYEVNLRREEGGVPELDRRAEIANILAAFRAELTRPNPIKVKSNAGIWKVLRRKLFKLIPRDREDKDWLERLEAGDPVICREFESRARGVIGKVFGEYGLWLGNGNNLTVGDELAADVTQVVFQEISDDLRCPSKKALYGYVGRAARNAALAYVGNGFGQWPAAGQDIEDCLDARGESAPPSQEEAFEAAAKSKFEEEIMALARRLPWKERTALLMKSFYGHGHEATGVLIDEKVGTVASWHKRAITALRKELQVSKHA